MAAPNHNENNQVDYIACDLPEGMTLEQYRRGLCAEQRRLPSLRALSARWLRRQPRD